jgi:2,3-bisphosphoglycerate-independent phosphoglycerate mutase
MSPVVLIILDGWGIAPPGPGNAITQANAPFFQKLWSAYPHTKIQASGKAVGLPQGEDGNTEVGHINMGAGQIVFQDLPRINTAIADGSFFQNPVLIEAINYVKKNQSTLHFLGLIGSGGVHANNEHLFALIKFAKLQNISQLALHLITDGRDSPPTTAKTYLTEVEEQLKTAGLGRIASIMGRYYGMDRDFRWDRTAKAYQCLVEGKGQIASSWQEIVDKSYAKNITDEFIEPTNLIDEKTKQPTLVNDNDAVIFYNFRVDRPRQLTKAFVLTDFETVANKPAFDPLADKYLHTHIAKAEDLNPPFKRNKVLKNLFFVTMTNYQKGLPVKIVMSSVQIENPLSRVVAENGLRQLKMSETEKERFVTYYFNGLREQPFTGEDWQIIPSPSVATYDLKPEMSTPELTRQLIAKLNQRLYQLIVINIACVDMVGHSGNITAAIRAVEAADSALSQIVPAVQAQGGSVIITADHGNTEEMINLSSGEIDTEHSLNPVPLIIVNDQLASSVRELPAGVLADVAPTIIKLLGLSQPPEMTGKVLI